jgi:pimeloyl-ACP methyl ester carboxylesterase
MSANEREELVMMSTTTVPVDGAALHVQRHGSGDRLVLVHGAWGDGDSWAPVLGPLAEHYEVVTYDRRGHTRSTGGDRPGGRLEDAADLVAVVDALGGEAAHLVGNSAGASIVLTVAALHPDRCRTVAAHEPATTSLLTGHADPAVREALATAHAADERVRTLLEAGDHEAAARLFIDEVALGPGTFDSLPPERTDRWVANAPTFLDELDDPDDRTLEVDLLAASPVPILLTEGTESPLVMRVATEELAARVPNAELVVLDGADHVAHLTRTELYVDTLLEFHARTRAREANR